MRPTPANDLTLSPQQLEEWVWSDARLQTYAVIMGTRMPDLLDRLGAGLKNSELHDYECLLPGALSPSARAAAPFLVQLKAKTAFSQWLLFQAAAGFGDWGVVIHSMTSLLNLRSHARGLLQARLPDGPMVQLDWMDPVVLQAIVPLFAARELNDFMGPMHSVLLPTTARWSVLTLELGRLTTRHWNLAPAGAG